MKIYHLASFSGNIGDIINHKGFYSQIRNKYCDIEMIHQEEIRYYYYNSQKKRFDSKFVSTVNEYDLFILGGGNFFELWWDYSATGTTFDIDLELLKEIKIPIFINAIGIDDKIKPSQSNLQKFNNFLNVLFNHTDCLFTVRNDGSKEVFDTYFPEYSHLVKEIPDWGFYYKEIESDSYKSERKIGVNIVKDLSSIRYHNVDYDTFLSKFAIELDNLLAHDEDLKIVFLPHILSDIQASLDLINYLKTSNIRQRIEFSSLNPQNEKDLILNYLECELVFGMRFHSNIAAIALSVPVVGMHNFPKHLKMHKKIKRDKKFYIDLTQDTVGISNITNYLKPKILSENIYDQLERKKELEKETERFLKEFYLWIRRNDNE